MLFSRNKRTRSQETDRISQPSMVAISRCQPSFARKSGASVGAGSSWSFCGDRELENRLSLKHKLEASSSIVCSSRSRGDNATFRYEKQIQFEEKKTYEIAQKADIKKSYTYSIVGIRLMFWLNIILALTDEAI